MQALRDRPLFFLHLPKTAGTSLRELLAVRFAPTEILSLARTDSPERRVEQLAALDRYRFVHGHVPYAIVERFERRPFVVTMLRDPMERALSAFAHMQRQAPAVAQAAREGRVSRDRAADYAAAGRMSIGELIRREPLAAARHLGDIQAWLLAAPNVNERFEYGSEHHVSVSASDLARAKEHLAACDVVGITERIRESADLLAWALKTRPFGEVGTANRGSGRPSTAALDAATLDALAGLTARDRDLYAFACRLFEDRCSGLPRPRPGRNALSPERGHVHRGAAHVFEFDGPIPGDGWYAPERDGDRWFSWTGPTRDSTIRLAAPDGRCWLLRLTVVHAMAWDSVSGLDVRINGVQVRIRVQPRDGGHLLTAAVPARAIRRGSEGNLVVIRVPRVARPCEQDSRLDDTRQLGIAVSRVELAASDRRQFFLTNLRTFIRKSAP